MSRPRKYLLRVLPYLFPLLLLLGLFAALPVLGTIENSFFRDIPFLPRHWAGFENYRAILSSSDFRKSLCFTLLFTAVSVPIEIVLGYVYALTLNAVSRRRLLQAVLLLPWALPLVVAGRLWQLDTDYHSGILNLLLTRFGFEPVNWLGTPARAFTLLVVADSWKTAPFVAIILYAALTTIPQSLYEQASVDGAGLLRRFLFITLPLTLPSAFVAGLFRSVDALRIFDLVFVLTHGGPGGGTTSLSLLAYRYYLSGDFGTGGAVSVLLFAVAFLVSLLLVRLLRAPTEAAV
ncbi:MAG: sugar ABC transporter permease [Candidatus Hydrogenedentota bacterium]|nr:MAG: sugar ABC transporter permease [Candidatus Hydrogenedentota bacterium]